MRRILFLLLAVLLCAGGCRKRRSTVEPALPVVVVDEVAEDSLVQALTEDLAEPERTEDAWEVTTGAPAEKAEPVERRAERRTIRPRAARRDATTVAGSDLNVETEAKLGAVVLESPSEARWGERFTVTARVSTDAIEVRSYQAGTLVRTSTIETTRTMEARLHADGAGVEDRSSPVQSVDDGVTTWVWSVTPTEVGEVVLRLTVVRIDEFGSARDVAYEDRVTVRSRPVAQAVAFLGRNWQWVFGTVLIPLFAWLFPIVRRRAKRKDAC